jgi:uncharacterized lipoprotein NlpE involved in copper resistance
LIVVIFLVVTFTLLGCINKTAEKTAVETETTTAQDIIEKN